MNHSALVHSANKSSSSIEHFIEQTHGPQQALQLSWLVPLTVIYLLILVCGLLGNAITILIIYRFRYMQTITNLYLCNLAITDLLSLTFSLPLELYSLWHQYPWQLGDLMCRMKTLVLEGTANASVLTLVAFTVERYLAICGSSKSHLPPSSSSLFNAKSLSRIKRIASRNIALIWTISLVGAVPLVSLTRVNYLQLEGRELQESAWCGLAYNAPERRAEFIMLSSTVVFFFIPLVLISCLYFRIAAVLKKATRLNSYSDIQLTDRTTQRKIVQSRKIVIRMLVAIVIVFTFCWSPFHAQRLFFIYASLYSDWSDLIRQINSILFLTAGCLYYLNSSLNPLIYSLLSSRFRAAFMLYANSCCGYWLGATGQHHQQGGNTNNSNGQPRSRNGAGKSNSNNSVAIAINGAGCQQLKNTCLINEPGVVAKVHWANKNSHCLHNSHVSSNHHQPQNSW